MNLSKEWLLQKILEFMVIIYDCRTNTKYANDRSMYSEDLVYVMNWIKELNNNVAVENVAKEIMKSNASKHFSDYWRQGEWGNKEIESFEKLRKEVEAKL